RRLPDGQPVPSGAARMEEGGHAADLRDAVSVTEEQPFPAESRCVSLVTGERADEGGMRQAEPAHDGGAGQARDMQQAASPTLPAQGSSTLSHGALHTEWRRRMYVRLLEAIDLRRRDVVSMSDAALRAEADALLVELVAEAQDDMP